MDNKEALQIIGVLDNSTDEEVKRAYRILVRKYHPDNRVSGDVNKFNRVNEAYKWILNKNKLDRIRAERGDGKRNFIVGGLKLRDIEELHSKGKISIVDDSGIEETLSLFEINKHVVKFEIESVLEYCVKRDSNDNSEDVDKIKVDKIDSIVDNRNGVYELCYDVEVSRDEIEAGKDIDCKVTIENESSCNIVLRNSSALGVIRVGGLKFNVRISRKIKPY